MGSLRNSSLAEAGRYVTGPVIVLCRQIRDHICLWPHWMQITSATASVLLVVVMVAITAAAISGDSDSPNTEVAETEAVTGTGEPQSTQPSSSAAPDTRTTATPIVTSTPAPPTAATAPDLAALRIGDPREAASYSRDLFPTWLDLDGNGCDARDEVLAAESTIPVTKVGGCDVASGSWLSIYDGVTVTEPSKLDVDHMVPLAEAWRSGAYAWDGNRRAQFANHTADPDHLIAVTAASNRSKSDSPPNEWRPPIQSSWCRYATAWVNIKVRWALTSTNAERDALGQMLETC